MMTPVGQGGKSASTNSDSDTRTQGFGVRELRPTGRYSYEREAEEKDCRCEAQEVGKEETELAFPLAAFLPLRATLPLLGEMGEYLENTLERLLPYANAERMSRSAVSWKRGAANRLVERITEEAESRKRASEGATGAGSTALVLRDVYAREHEANYGARYGAGAFKQAQIRDAEWEAGQAAREQRAQEARVKAEKEWLEYLQMETPEQKRQREREEAKERLKEERASARRSNSYWNEQAREAEKIDRDAFKAGERAAKDIGLSSQVSEGRTRIPAGTPQAG